LLIVAAIALVAVPPARAGDMKAELARRMNAKPGDFVLNFPPRFGCLPGSIFTDDLRLPLERTHTDDPALTRGPAFGLDADLGEIASAETGGTFAPIFGFLLSHRSLGTTTVQIEQAHVIEILGGDLKKRLLASEAARSAANRGIDPFVVFRAYEGIISLNLTRKRDTTADAWARVKADSAQVHASGELASDDAVLFKLPERIVFAFEIMRATYVTTHLGTGPNEVVLRKISADQFRR